MSTNLVLSRQDDGIMHFELPPTEEVVVKGIVRTELPYLFKAGKSCIRIGSSSIVSDVVIEGAERLHAALVRNSRSQTWWVYDCGSQAGTFVNGERVHVRELALHDIISIAQVNLGFLGNRLETRSQTGQGISLSVDHLTFNVPGRSRPILDDVTFTVSPGEFVGILGPSGCGKSSLVQRLVGLAKADSGAIMVNGHAREEVESEFQSLTAYLPQNVDETLHDTLTLGEEIDCFRRIHLARLRKQEDEHRQNADCLKVLGLQGKELSRIGSLSGGEKRRVGIALALLRQPQLLLLDEPGAGLDPASEETLMNHLRIIVDQGRTVLCVTHVLANARKFDKLMVLSRGKVVFFDSPQKLLGSFGAEDYGRLYEMLESGNCGTVYSPPTVDQSRQELPKIPCPATRTRIVGGYIKRFAIEFFSSNKHGLDFSRIFSAPMNFFVWQPLGLVIGLRLACACYFRTITGSSTHDVEMLGFCSALSVFWISINNAARVLVKERVPGRCLERLNRVPLASYLIAKVIWSSTVCAIQTLSFTLLLCIAARIPLSLKAQVADPSLAITSVWLGPLLLTGLLGTVCGLAVSATAKKELSAVSVVPNLAILALLFSEAVVRFEQGGDFYAPVAKSISVSLMPCYWPAKLMDCIQNGVTCMGEIWHLLSLSFMYILVGVILTVVCQRRNERVWDGR
ncbi:MAG: ATP-binding cassette domain-containing protein [bacterium]|nr:ATP-binding cassette domain-containing protein [bacterium]